MLVRWLEFSEWGDAFPLPEREKIVFTTALNEGMLELFG
jgi:hypothetical protein